MLARPTSTHKKVWCCARAWIDWILRVRSMLVGGWLAWNSFIRRAEHIALTVRSEDLDAVEVCSPRRAKQSGSFHTCCAWFAGDIACA